MRNPGQALNILSSYSGMLIKFNSEPFGTGCGFASMWMKITVLLLNVDDWVETNDSSARTFGTLICAVRK